MATYSFHIKPQPTTKYGTKMHASQHAIYILREMKYNEREDLYYQESKNLPEWANEDPITYWKAADLYERKNSNAYREITWALPTELPMEENKKLVDEFCQKHFNTSYTYTYAIHSKPSSIEGVQNIHVHIMFSERELDPSRSLDKEQHFMRYSENANGEQVGGYKKNREWQKKHKLYELREDAALFINKYYKKNNLEERVDHRSFKDQKKALEDEGRFTEAELLSAEPKKRVPASVYYIQNKQERIEAIKEIVEDERETESVGYSNYELRNELVEKLRTIKGEIFNEYQNEDIIYMGNIKDFIGEKRQEVRKEIKKIVQQIDAKKAEKIHPKAIETYIKNSLTNGEYGRVLKEIKHLEENISYQIKTNKNPQLQEKRLLEKKKRMESFTFYSSMIDSKKEELLLKNETLQEEIKKLYGSLKNLERKEEKYTKILEKIMPISNKFPIYEVKKLGITLSSNTPKKTQKQPTLPIPGGKKIAPISQSSSKKLSIINNITRKLEKEIDAEEVKGFTASRELTEDEIQDLIASGKLER